MKIIFLETKEKEENFDVKIWFLEKNLIYCDFSKINRHKVIAMKVSVKILKLTYQMISKSRKSPMHRNITIREIQWNQNW